MMYYAPRILLRSRPMPHPTTCILPAVRRDAWGLRLEAGRARAVLPCCAVCGTVLQHTAERECARVDLRFPYCISLDHCCISVFRYFDVYPRSVASRPHAERRHRPFHWVDRGGGKKGSSATYHHEVLYLVLSGTVRKSQDRRAQENQTGEHTKNKHGRPGRIQEKARRSPGPSLASPISASSPRPSPPDHNALPKLLRRIISRPAASPRGWLVHLRPSAVGNVAAPARRCTTDHRPPTSPMAASSHP
jgi:hypothetical protein